MSAKRKRKDGKTSAPQTSEVFKTSEVSEIQPAPYDLPDGWKWMPLGEICEISGGGTPRREEPRYYEKGTIPWATPTDIDAKRIVALERTITSITEIGLRESSARIVKPGTVLFSSRASIGKIAIAAVPMTTNQGFANHTPLEGVDSWFIAYGLRLFTEQIKELGSGTTFIEVPKSGLKKFLFPLPPLPEQRRIVAKIEQLIAESRTARDALERVPALLKRFRQSVLAAAFRGQLTERDPDDEPASALLERIRVQRLPKSSKLRKSETPAPPPPDTSDLPELPEGWVWASLGSLAQIRNGVTKGRNLSGFKTIEVPYLRVANVPDGYLDLNIVKTIEIKADELEKYKLHPNDILFIEGGDRDKLGRGTVWHGEIEPCIHQNHVHCARLNTESILPAWVSLASSLQYARDYFWNTASQTVNLASLNATGLKALPIPLAPIAEQRRIVARIKALFAQADTIERAVAIARQRADKIDQAILSRAFRGEL